MTPRMRRNSVLVLVAIALLLAGWFAVRQRSETGLTTVTPDRAGGNAERGDRKGLDAPQVASQPRASIDSAAISAESSSAAAGQSAHDGPTLIVSVVSKADGKPLSDVRVFVSRSGSDPDGVTEVQSTHGDLAHAPISDALGHVELDVPAGEALDVEAASKSEGCGRATAEVKALGPHETRTIEVRVPCGDDLRFFGRLLDHETRLPIVGARIQMMRGRGGATDADGVWHPIVKSILELRTDAAGRFHLALPSWAEPYLRIEADGYGPLHALLQPGHDSEARAQDLLASRAASLHAFVLDASGKPITNTSIHLIARGYELQKGGEAEEPGSWIDYPDEERHADFDVHGSSVIEGLPAHVPLGLEIHQGARLLRREPDPLQLEPGQVLERTWTIGAGARIEGRIVDQLAVPVAKREIWLMKKSGTGEAYLEAYKHKSTTAKAASDDEGRFVLEDVAIGSWWIAAAPNADAFAIPTASDVASKTQTLEVTSAAAQSVTLVVSRGLLIRGRVLDPEGNAVFGDFVTCTQEGGWFPGRTRTDEAGAFVVGPLAPGACMLVANEHEGFAASEQVTAEPGQTDVVLRLKPAGKISGHVVDAATGEPREATVHVTPEHEAGSFLSGEFESETRGEGRFLLENLPPDRYHIWFATTDGRFGTLSGIPVIAGKESGDHVVKVVPGGTVVIRYEGKERSAALTILSGSDHLSFGHSIDIDQPETKRVPAGRITIEYTVGAKPERHTLSVDVGVGETREVVLKDDG